MKPIKVGLVSLGCSKNLVDSERMLFKLRAAGYQLVTEPGEAEIAIVNTCGFIQSAKEEAIDTILELAALKRDGTLQKIILTGCLTERYRQEAADLFEEVDAVIGIGDNKDIVEILNHCGVCAFLPQRTTYNSTAGSLQRKRLHSACHCGAPARCYRNRSGVCPGCAALLNKKYPALSCLFHPTDTRRCDGSGVGCCAGIV